MIDLSNALLALLFDWSIRFGVLILILAAWFWFRPPESAALRLLLGRLVLVIGLLLPFSPRWIPVPSWVSLRANTENTPVDASVRPFDALAARTPPLQSANAPIDNAIVRDLGPLTEPPKAARDQTNRAIESDRFQAERPLAFPTFFASIWEIDWRVGLVCIWLAGVGFCLLRLLLGSIWLGRFKRHCRPAPLFIRAEWEQLKEDARIPFQVPIVMSNRVRTPALLGGWNPMIVLPDEWQQAAPEDRRAVLLHEGAHLCHRDDWFQAAEELVRAFFFFHPLVHALIRQIGIDREHLCDVRVVQSGVSPNRLAALLVEQIKRMGSERSILSYRPLSSFFQTKTALNRVEKLLAAKGSAWYQPLCAWQKAVCIISIGFLAAGIGSVGILSAGPHASESALLAQLPDEVKTVAVAGTVLMPNGLPASGVSVWCCLAKVGPRQRVETTTNGLGQFRFDLAVGNWSFWAIHGELGGDGKNGQEGNSWKLQAEGKLAPILIPLENRGSFTGRLIESESKKPLAGASVYLNDGRVLKTDTEGRWRVSGLKRSRQYAVVVAPHRVRKNFSFDLVAPGKDELEIDVPLGVLVRGTVVDALGKPVPNSWVAMLVSGPGFANKGRFESCDQQGRFELPLTQGYETYLTASAPGFEWNTQTLIPENDSTSELKFQLKKLAHPPSAKNTVDEENERTISGKVLAPGGEPLEGAAVNWDSDRLGKRLTTRTGKGGSYRLNTPDEEGLLVVEFKEWKPEFVEVDMGADQKVDATLKAGHFLAGKVVDKQGKPIEGVNLAVNTAEEDYGWLGEKDTKTNAKGEYAFRGLPDGCYFTIWKEGFIQKNSEEYKLDQLNHVISMESDEAPLPGAMKCRLIDFEGQPIRHFEITSSRPHQKEPTDSWPKINDIQTNESLSFTASDGRFTLTGLEVGPYYRIRAYAAGHGLAVIDRVQAVPMDQLPRVEEVVLRAEKPKSLKVTAVDHLKRPIAGARLTLIDQQTYNNPSFSWSQPTTPFWKTNFPAQTDASGVAIYPDLSFQEGLLTARSPGFGRIKIPWNKGQSELAIAMQPEAVLEGELSGPFDQWKEAQAFLYSKENGQMHFSIRANDQWKFKIHELPAGVWTIEYGFIFSQMKKETIELKSGETKTWVGKLKP